MSVLPDPLIQELKLESKGNIIQSGRRMLRSADYGQFEGGPYESLTNHHGRKDSGLFVPTLPKTNIKYLNAEHSRT